MRRSLNAILLAGAALALVAPASAETYFFRSKPEVSPPQAFSFTPAANIAPGGAATSAPVRIKGYRNSTAAVSGDAGAAYQVCAAADCSDQSAWLTGPTANVRDDFYARVRVTAGTYGASKAATLAVGGTSSTFTATTRGKDTTPDALVFASTSGSEPGAAVRSAPVQVNGHEGVTLSVSGGGYQICPSSACSSMDSAAVQTGTSAEVANGTWVRLVATPAAFSASATVTLTAGGTVGTFTAAARAKDTVPDAIAAFTNVASATASADVTSEARQLVNHDGAQVSVSGTSAQYRICTTSACSSATGWQTTAMEAAKDSWVQLKLTASGTGSERRDAVLSYGGLTTTWSVTAAPAGAGTYSISTMGINSATLRSALIGKLGDGRDWVPCKGSGAVESCAGAKGLLITHRSVANGTEYGTYVQGDLSSHGIQTWSTIPGFHYTTKQGSNHVFDRTGILNGTGGVDFFLQNDGNWYFIPLYMASTTSPMVFPNNNYTSTGWTVGWSLSGGGHGSSETTVFTAYKKK